jgi:histidinol phosphatase-like enzyme (inositol monophosphatase family)
MSDAGVSDRLAFAERLAVEAGRAALDRFARAGLRVEHKSDGSPVTDADRAAERHARDLLTEFFPDDGVLGEEMAETRGRSASGWRWIIDPIDGTRSFIHGVPLWGTLVACEHTPPGGVARFRVGVVNMPALGERVAAAEGGPARWTRADGSVVDARVSRTGELSQAMVVTTSADYFRGSGELGTYLRLAERAGATRGWSDCYGAVLLATGRADAWVEPVMQKWDLAAPAVVIRAAGGRVTDWAGSEAIESGHTLASNGRVHAALVDVLSGAKPGIG